MSYEPRNFKADEIIIFVHKKVPSDLCFDPDTINYTYRQYLSVHWSNSEI